MTRFWRRTWAVLRAVVLLLIGLSVLVLGLGVYWSWDHQPPKRQYDRQTDVPDSIRVEERLNPNDLEPNTIEVYHRNRAFAGATVTLSTLNGSVSRSFDQKMVRDEDGDWEEQEIILPNPGRMRQGWTLDVVYRNSHRRVQFRSQRSGLRSSLSLHLYISAAGRGPRLYCNNVKDPLSREIILLPSIDFLPSQAIAAI